MVVSRNRTVFSRVDGTSSGNLDGGCRGAATAAAEATLNSWSFPTCGGMFPVFCLLPERQADSIDWILCSLFLLVWISEAKQSMELIDSTVVMLALWLFHAGNTTLCNSHRPPFGSFGRKTLTLHDHNVF